MKLLLDANLSWRIVALLKEHFTDCLHIDSTALSVPAKDNEIWEFAKANDFLIVTNDEDFLDLMNVKGFPPKVILLKTGNQNNKAIYNTLVKHKSEILQLYEAKDYGLLEIFS